MKRRVRGVGQGVYLMTMAPELGRLPSTECRDVDVRWGDAGVRHFIAASWQRRAGWERPAAQPLTHRRRRFASQCYL